MESIDNVKFILLIMVVEFLNYLEVIILARKQSMIFYVLALILMVNMVTLKMIENFDQEKIAKKEIIYEIQS